MKSKLPEIIRDGSIIAGAGCLVYGTWLLWQPLALMLAGIGLMGFSILWETDRQRRKPRRDTEQTRQHPRDFD